MKKYVSILMLLSIWSVTAFADTPKTLNIFAWSEYIPYDVLKDFTEETGIKVTLSTFESNEAMYAKLKLLEGKGYDIVTPTSYVLEWLRNDNLLACIDKNKIIGLKNLTPDALGRSFDPTNTYSIPYMWGYLGVLVNTKIVDPKSITSFDDLNRPEFKGKVLLSDDLRDTFGVALKACGYSVNTTNPEEIKAAYEWLKRLKPSIRVFDITATKQAFISEEVWAGISWNGDAYIAMQENPYLKFVIPHEGLILWIDNFSILKDSKNKEHAYTFISFLLRPEIAKRCVEAFNYTTPNVAARKLLDPLYRENTTIFPGDDTMAKGEVINEVGKAFDIYAAYWEALKLSQ